MFVLNRAMSGLVLTPASIRLYRATRVIVTLARLDGSPSKAIRELKQIATAGATTAAVTEKVWGEYVAAVCQILAK